MKEDLEGLGVCRHNDQLGDATVERLRGLVGALLQLLLQGRLARQVQQPVRELGIGQRSRPRFRRRLLHLGGGFGLNFGFRLRFGLHLNFGFLVFLRWRCTPTIYHRSSY